MRASCGAAAAALLLGALTGVAQEGTGTPQSPQSPPPAAAPAWSASVTGFSYLLPGQDDVAVAVATAEKGSLHLEARYQYEAPDSGSLFAGWKFSGGGDVTWEATPILGGVFGGKNGISPGLEAAVAYGIADLYVEAEYVFDLEVEEDSFAYAWSELGFAPWEWMRLGLVGQRTTVYRSERDIQRGLFAQLAYRRATVGFYLFNPDDGDTRFAVLSLGIEF